VFTRFSHYSFSIETSKNGSYFAEKNISKASLSLYNYMGAALINITVRFAKAFL